MKAAVVCAALLVACSQLEPLPETLREEIPIESADLPGTLWEPFMPPITDGEPVTLDGALTIPPTDEPVPAVIIAHGCGGVGGAERGWVDDLAKAGYAVLIVDSFGARNLGLVCTGTEPVNVASIVVDVFRAADTLATHPYIDGEKLAVLGISFGGRAAIWSSMDDFREAYDGRVFSAHIAFYPSTCFIELANETAVSGSPIRIFHGTADNWTPIDQCQAYARRMSDAGEDVAVIAYEGAHHGFDDETTAQGLSHFGAPSPRNCRFVEIDGKIIDPDTGDVAGAGSPCVELGVTGGWNSAAHKQSKIDLLELLSEVFADVSE